MLKQVQHGKTAIIILDLMHCNNTILTTIIHNIFSFAFSGEKFIFGIL